MKSVIQYNFFKKAKTKIPPKHAERNGYFKRSNILERGTHDKLIHQFQMCDHFEGEKNDGEEK